jgi:hypothetical protein
MVSELNTGLFRAKTAGLAFRENQITLNFFLHPGGKRPS